MAMLVTHPDYLDTSLRLDAYRQFLEHVVEQPRCWKALPSQIANWWRQRDNLEILRDDASAEIIGPQSDRARLLRASDFLAHSVPVRSEDARD